MRVITTWFINESLDADYGTFECQKCGRIFYYSPRDVEIDGETVMEGICALCAAKY